MAFIYRRTDSKFWWVGFQEGGQQTQKSLKVTAKRAAELLLAEYQMREAKEHNKSKLLHIKKRLRDVINEYADSRPRSKTSRWYRWCGEEFAAFCEGKGAINIGNIHPHLIEEFYSKRKKEGRDKIDKARKNESDSHDKMDPGGAASILRGIKAIFNYAVKKHYIIESPAKHVRADRTVKKLYKDLSVFEMERLLKAAKEHCQSCYALYATGYYAGLRDGELVYLKQGDIDFEQNYIDVKSKPENPIKDHQERRIPLNGKLKQILLEHTPGRVWFFETREGNPRRNGLNRELKRTARYAAIHPKGLNMRVLRESFGSHLRRLKVDIALISQYMGHSSIDVTLRHYAHIALEDTKKEIDLL